ncbi:MAG TPA: hypothetical protein VKD66_04625 [Streptosporangiaceae bacterium]|nr:hypothetical protein [Streptosporangiaceae bacterium]
MDRTHPLADAPQAIRHLAGGHAAGKVVITVSLPANSRRRWSASPSAEPAEQTVARYREMLPSGTETADRDTTTAAANPGPRQHPLCRLRRVKPAVMRPLGGRIRIGKHPGHRPEATSTTPVTTARPENRCGLRRPTATP